MGWGASFISSILSGGCSFVSLILSRGCRKILILNKGKAIGVREYILASNMQNIVGTILKTSGVQISRGYFEKSISRASK